MHTEDTAPARSNARSAGSEPLTAIVPLARPDRAGVSGAGAGALELAVTGNAADERALSVRYELDVVTHRWVASIMDDVTGEVVRTVPSRQVLHQLAALRHPPVDVRA